MTGANVLSGQPFAQSFRTHQPSAGKPYPHSRPLTYQANGPLRLGTFLISSIPLGNCLKCADPVPRSTGAVCRATQRRTEGKAPDTTPSTAQQGLDLSSPGLHPHINGTRFLERGHQNGQQYPEGAQNNEVARSWPRSEQSPAAQSPAAREASSAGPDRLQLQQEQPAIRLLYATGWQNPVIHYSAQGADWQTEQLTQVSSAGGHLFEALIELRHADQPTGLPSDAVSLEFVITDGLDHWDKPATGANYSLTGSGTFVLRDGEVQAVPGSRCLVVSDLDDTLIGNDAGTEAFKQFWEQEAVIRGSRLVFNTGRALDSFLAVQAQKPCLPIPDLLIAAVGTKIYSCSNGSSWEEDAHFAARLDEGWDLNVVREACYQAVMSVGREAMHFRPPEEQNNHKVTCGVLAAQAASVQASIQSALDQHRVAAKLVFSGKGEWRYLDIVSCNAGKAEALNFAMEKLGFSPGNTVACGDSGNDKDMLAAANLAVVAHHAHGILEGLQQLGFADR
ncbi:hypothetical protein WJX84_001547 [Apatococcus fuscideae]|uniref:Sucrose phosphatase-like domain-containing protein n=1 Tax=Apatococcus fuscideae TaxID=2026836 RepID=A0AAW1T3G8_9CHLO